MRYSRGRKVEVLNKGDFPSGSWRNAEIISGNGRYYNVKYDRSLGDRDVMIAERVPRKAIRPCPPMVVIENWVAGDIVEVFHNNSWKIAKILKAIGGKCFSVTLLGSSQELKVHKFDVRVRQSWQDDQWVVIRKNSGCYEDKQGNKLPAEMHYNNSNYGVMKQAANVKVHAGYHHFPVEDDLNSQCPQGVSARSMKRGSEYCSSHIDTLVESSRKMRALEGKRQQLVSGHPYPLLEKVDAVASPQPLLGENYMHASFKNRMTGFSEICMEKGQPNGYDRFFIPPRLEPSDSESSACSSVASCGSTNHGLFTSHHHLITDLSKDTDSQFVDAISSSERECDRESSFPTKEELADEIHKLELHAYRSTMEALYASGPLSWDQEAMMANLRLMLHITNDEHLLELRHLISTETAFC